MKLPGIQYSKEDPGAVPTISPWTHVRDAQHQADAIDSIGDTIDQIRNQIHVDKATQYLGRSLTELSRAESEAKSNPDALNSPNMLVDAANAINTKAKEELNPNVYRLWKREFDNQFNATQRLLFADSIIRANAEQRAMFKQDVDSISREGQIEIALDMINNATMYTDSEKEAMRTEARINGEIASVERIKYSKDPLMIKSALEQLNSNEYSGSLTPNMRDSAIRDLNTAFELATAEQREAAAHAAGRVFGNLKIAILRGEAGATEVEASYDRFPDVITPARRAELLVLIEKQKEKHVKQANLKSLVNISLLNQEPLDPKNKDHIEAVDMHFADNPTLETGMDLAIKTNIMPSAVESEFRRQAIAGKPARVLELSNAFEVLQRKAPQTLDKIGAKQVAIYGTVSALNRSGVPLQDAVEIARENASKPIEYRNELRQRYEERSRDANSRLQDIMDSSDLFDISILPTGAPKPSVALSTAFKAAEAEYYTWTNGDEDLAEKFAAQHISRIFSTSEINGKAQTFAYAPERVTGIPQKFLRQDLIKFAHKHGMVKDNIIVTSDDVTARERGIKSYPVFKLNEFMLPEPALNENGEQLRWTPDIKAYQKKLEEEARDERWSKGLSIDIGGYPFSKPYQSY